MRTPLPVGVVRVACGLSGHVHPVKAIDEVAEQCLAGLEGAAADLVMAFFSTHHLEAARAVAYAIRKRLTPKCLLGISAESVLAGEKELERAPGISVFAASLPGVGMTVQHSSALMPHIGPGSEATLAEVAGMTPETRAMFVLADPFSVPMNSMLPALCRARPRAVGGRAIRAPIMGGMASAAREAGRNTMFIDDMMFHEGAVSVTLNGPVRVDAMVSQGCRPFGPPMIVTAGKGQIISALAGKPALQAISEAVEELDERGKKLLERGGLFIGRAVSEYRERFGRDDFLIRPILGVDRNSEAIAVGDIMRVGQTVQLHVRDAETAVEDLEMLLDIQRLHGTPAGALLFTCNGRGKRLFERADHDTASVARAFGRVRPGEEQAKAGEKIPGSGPTIPVAGFFAAGEIGPLGDEAYVHGHTACAAFFRSAPPSPADV